MQTDDDLASHTDYVRNAVPLMIWHARHAAIHGGPPVPFKTNLDRHIDLYRKTTCYDGETDPVNTTDFHSTQWESVKSEIETISEHFAFPDNSAAMEAACMDFLWPILEPRLEQDSRPARKGPTRPYGCWNYDEHTTNIVIHFVNVYRPESPFEVKNVTLTAADLLECLCDARRRYPAATRVCCGTWLNHILPFQALFPCSWLEEITDLGGLGTGLGWWGPYMDRHGAFHHHNAETFRRIGRHPYPATVCDSGLDEAIAHLEAMT